MLASSLGPSHTANGRESFVGMHRKTAGFLSTESPINADNSRHDVRFCTCKVKVCFTLRCLKLKDTENEKNARENLVGHVIRTRDLQITEKARNF